MKKGIRAIKLLLAALLVVGVAMSVHSKRERQVGSGIYDKARSVARLEPDSRETQAAVPEGPEYPAGVARLLELDLEALRAVNPDVLGWLEIPGTGISYPVVQGADNQYYLNHTWDREKNPVGSIFLECQNSPEMDGVHTIIYGHRMDNDSMFGPLKYYKDLSYWQEHPTVCLADGGGVTCYSIFSAREADVRGLVYRLDMVESDLMEEFLQDCLSSSVIDTGLTPSAGSQILTLSTCVSLGRSNTRWVVHAVRGEHYGFPDSGGPSG